MLKILIRTECNLIAIKLHSDSCVNAYFKNFRIGKEIT